MILITGASGNVGAAVLTQALTAGLGIRAAYFSPQKVKAAPAGVQAVLMDYRRPESMREALAGVEKAFLVSPPVADLAELEGRFVDEARKAGVRHIVKLSALGGRRAIFPSLHRDAEERIESSGLPYTFLRANGFMQNFVNYNAGTIKSQDAFFGAQGDGAVSHVDVRDIAAVGVLALSGPGHEGKAYALTGPEALTNAQVAGKLSLALGRTIRYIDVPPDVLRKSLSSAGAPEWSANAVVDLQRLYREGGAGSVHPTVEQLTGRPARPFDAFAREHAWAFREEARAGR